MNAIDFLIKEHHKVRTLLADIADETHRFDTQKKRFDFLAQVLIRHENMEHEVWYPQFKNDLPAEVKHLVQEEKIAEREINKMNELKTEDAWKDHFIEFKHNVEHHAQEEEQKLFSEVEKILSKNKLEDIGCSMALYKKKHFLHQSDSSN